MVGRCDSGMKINLKQVSLFTILILLTLPLMGTHVYATVTCGSTIISNTTLTGNLNCSTSIGIIIGVNGITLNCAGHSITQTVTGTGDGIELLGVTGVTVEKCIVKNWNTGFYLSSSLTSSITLTGNTATSNDLGFGFYSSSGNTLKSNTASSNSEWGFYFLSSSSNTLTGNTATSTRLGDGFSFISSSSNTLTGNTATSTTYGTGFYFDGSSSNTLTSNTAKSNGYDGFWLFSSSNQNTLTSNTATGNAASGFDFESTSSNTLTGNTAKSNKGDGFYMDSATSGNTLTSNVANSNHGYGYADYSTGSGTAGTANTYTGNKATGNVLGASKPSGLAV
jgi:parallel beta-helix repeat protein